MQAQGSHDTDIGHTLKGKAMRSDEKKSRRYADEELETGGDQRQGKRLRSSDSGDHLKPTSKDYKRREEGRARRYADEHLECKSREGDDRKENKRSRRGNDDFELRTRDGHYRTEEKQLLRHESESYSRTDENRRGEHRSTHDRDLSSTRHRGRDDQRRESGR